MLLKICLIMALFTFNSCGDDAAQQPAEHETPSTAGHFTTASTIRDVLSHPAFDGGKATRL